MLYCRTPPGFRLDAFSLNVIHISHQNHNYNKNQISFSKLSESSHTAQPCMQKAICLQCPQYIQKILYMFANFHMLKLLMIDYC